MNDETRYPPLISSGVAGPLGVLHLPRLWQKALLGAAGRLPPEYPACGRGFDQMVLDGLRVGREDFLAFIAADKPDYPALERWILARNGGPVEARVVAELNRSIAGHAHGEATRAAILADCGIAPEDAPGDAVTLNNLDDWQAFHAACHRAW